MVAIGFGQHVGERDIGVRAKGGGRTIAGLDEFHPDTQRFKSCARLPVKPWIAVLLPV